jgi:hypothetical protein
MRDPLEWIMSDPEKIFWIEGRYAQGQVYGIGYGLFMPKILQFLQSAIC